jgi:hypothetical protein
MQFNKVDHKPCYQEHQKTHSNDYYHYFAPALHTSLEAGAGAGPARE